MAVDTRESRPAARGAPVRPGTLYVVATPLGNLEDITLRALRVLKEVDLIAAEDTRHSRKLLLHYGIDTPLTSYYDQIERRKAPQLVAGAAARQEHRVDLRRRHAGHRRPGLSPGARGDRRRRARRSGARPVGGGGRAERRRAAHRPLRLRRLRAREAGGAPQVLRSAWRTSRAPSSCTKRRADWSRRSRISARRSAIGRSSWCAS